MNNIESNIKLGSVVTVSFMGASCKAKVVLDTPAKRVYDGMYNKRNYNSKVI